MATHQYDPNYKPGSVKAWINYRLPIFDFIDNSVGSNYPTPRNLNYWWSFGSMAGVCLVVQILTGIFLAMHYAPDAKLAFDSVENIMRNVNHGWLIRYIHAVGASMFFVVVYIHMARNLYFGSFKAPREVLWWLGIVIFLLMMATAFMGYVLPWGQMSFWGATVITNLFSAIPMVGESIVHWLWGGFSVDNPTLNRFFALHYLMPFILFAVVFLHLWALHTHGSNNPLGIEVKGPQDTIPFHPYYTVKDAFCLAFFMFIFAWFVFWQPNLLGHSDNYIPANALVTPPHIVPEWYFLPFYAILRAVPDIGIPYPALSFSPFSLGLGYFVLVSSKLAGVLCMFGSIIILFFLPWIDGSKVRSAAFRPVYRILFWVFVANMFLLGYMGARPPEGIYIIIGRAATLYYFLHYVLVYFVSRRETPLPVPESIAQGVLEHHSHAH